MTHTQFPILALVSALAAAFLAPACGEGGTLARTPPNVVLISIDTLRADHLGVYGSERATSPRIDALAERSLVFEQAFSQSPKTAPSHMSILTGVVPDLHGVKNLQDDGDNRPLSGGIPTLAEILDERGYLTAAVSGGGHVIGKLGFDRGFDDFASSNDPERVFDLGWKAIKNRGDRPFFVFLHTYEVHDPYTPPDEFRDMFVDPDYEGAVISSRAEMGRDKGAWQVRHEEYWSRVAAGNPADLQRLKDLYSGSIRYVDGLVGAFLERLEAAGLADDTIVVLLSDHGEEFQEHGGFLHETVYQELLHVPLIVHVPERIPGRPPPGRVKGTVRLIDVLPTLLELLDVALPPHVQGRSLLGVARGEDTEERSVFSTWPRQGVYALRRGRYKLIERPQWKEKRGEARFELYDLTADPGERTDLLAAPTPEHERVRAELADELERIRTASARFQAALDGGTEVQLSEIERAELRALGYLK